MVEILRVAVKMMDRQFLLIYDAAPGRVVVEIGPVYVRFERTD